MVHPSTFSIVAYDPQEQAWGIAVASKFLAVGSVVPWARIHAGAVATQSYANTSFGPGGLMLMEGGLSASETLERLLAEDAERELRQVGLVDRQGGAATFTGSDCFSWAGGLTGTHFAAQGNILAGAQVVEALAETFTQTTGSLPHRLYAALRAADRSGGDRRGRQSAAIFVVKPQAGYGGFNDRWVDYRVDDHPDPVARLGELLELHHLYFDKSSAEDQLKIEGALLRDMKTIMLHLGYYHGEIDDIYDEAARSALEAFTGNENLEERTDLRKRLIDRPAYEFIMRQFSVER